MSWNINVFSRLNYEYKFNYYKKPQTVMIIHSTNIYITRIITSHLNSTQKGHNTHV